MKRFVMAVALICALSGVTLAGDVPSTDSPTPPPPAPVQAPNPVVTAVLTIINVVTP